MTEKAVKDVQAAPKKDVKEPKKDVKEPTKDVKETSKEVNEQVKNDSEMTPCQLLTKLKQRLFNKQKTLARLEGRDTTTVLHESEPLKDSKLDSEWTYINGKLIAQCTLTKLDGTPIFRYLSTAKIGEKKGWARTQMQYHDSEKWVEIPEANNMGISRYDQFPDAEKAIKDSGIADKPHDIQGNFIKGRRELELTPELLAEAREKLEAYKEERKNQPKGNKLSAEERKRVREEKLNKEIAAIEAQLKEAEVAAEKERAARAAKAAAKKLAAKGR